MSLALFTHADMLEHRPGAYHPERPQRLQTVMAALEDASDLDLELFEAPLAEPADLERVHSVSCVRTMFETAPKTGLAFIDADTVMSAGSLAAARRAAGAVVQAVRDV